MRTYLVSGGVVALAVLLGSVVTPVAQSSGANVIDDFGCAITLAPIGGPGVYTVDSHAVITPSGNVQFNCTGAIPPELAPRRAVRVVGLGCGTQGGFTWDSVNLYTPSGIAHLTCRINPSSK